MRSKLAAFFLAIFFGGFGVHNFYLGYDSKALIQLSCSLIFSWTFIVPIGIWIWAFVEGIMAITGSLKDADGTELAG
ncbi:MAG: TM2 domain-containing protein [Firmicutes bacterium]|nr:TM2 domain-containing protein [Bacillota bacterium]